MHKTRQRWLVGTLIAAGIAVALFACRQPQVAPKAPEPAARPAPVLAARPAPAPPGAAPVMPASTLAKDIDLPLAVQVERLLATGDPQDAYAAYMLVSSCSVFNRKHDLLVFDDKQGAVRGLDGGERQLVGKMCSTMTERERLARLDHLAIAVKAGVEGAVWSLVAEGPFGDPSALTTRPDDPLVREWKASVAAELTRQAEAGDPSTLMVWGFQKLNGSELTAADTVQGYGYLLASVIVEAERRGTSRLSAQAHADGSAMLSAIGSALTPEQRAAGAVVARQLADRAHARRKREG